jgi:hypothetical protein
MISFDRLGRLMDAEISGPTNYTALNLLSDMRKGIWKEANTTSTTVSIYRRNLQRTAYRKDGIPERRNQINSFS